MMMHRLLTSHSMQPLVDANTSLLPCTNFLCEYRACMKRLNASSACKFAMRIYSLSFASGLCPSLQATWSGLPLGPRVLYLPHKLARGGSLLGAVCWQEQLPGARGVRVLSGRHQRNHQQGLYLPSSFKLRVSAPEFHTEGLLPHMVSFPFWKLLYIVGLLILIELVL